MFLYIEFVCDNIRLSSVTIVLPDINVTVISLYENAINLTFMDVPYETTGNPASCPASYLTGVRFRGEYVFEELYVRCNIIQNWCRRRLVIYTPIHILASELGSPICCLQVFIIRM